jgi:iron complex transport system substrate-binding protein
MSTELKPRICSLLPSATEIVYALGLGEQIVAVTHECDYPSDAASKPRVTTSIINSDGLSSGEIDAAVRESLVQQATIYRLDQDLLADLEPDLVLTQELCDVCAVGFDTVRDACAALPAPPRVVSLEPTSLTEVLDSVELVGRLAGALPEAIALRAELVRRIQDVQKAVDGCDRLRVLTMEWIEPVFVGGHWVPEMVEIAGGVDVLGMAGKPSREASWEEITASDPDAIVVMPCGFGLDRSMEEYRKAELPAQWHDLRAVKSGCVFAVDGSSYFNRPGPRLVDGVEILASILHPEVFQTFPLNSFARVKM